MLGLILVRIFFPALYNSHNADDNQYKPEKLSPGAVVKFTVNKHKSPEQYRENGI